MCLNNGNGAVRCKAGEPGIDFGANGTLEDVTLVALMKLSGAKHKVLLVVKPYC